LPKTQRRRLSVNESDLILQPPGNGDL
jgi:hypothetical protein